MKGVHRAMGVKLVKKILHLLLVMWLVSFATFLLLEFVPGDPAIAVLGTSGTPEQYEQIRAQLGMDRSFAERYLEWIGGVLTGDFGRSLTPPYENVTDSLRARLPVTIEIAVLGMALALALSIPLGVWSAYRRGERFDRWTSTSLFAVMAMPTFLLGLVLIQLFVFNPGPARIAVGVLGAVGLAVWGAEVFREWRRSRRPMVRSLVAMASATAILIAMIWAWPEFPRQGFARLTGPGGLWENLRHVALPVLTVALGQLALLTRVLRAEMITTLDADFILAARAKGIPTHRILGAEALRPASFSLVTISGLSLGGLLGGTLIVEVMFNLPGMGRLLVEAIEVNDFVTVQAGVLVLALGYVLVNTVVDLSYALLDPRVRNVK